MSDVAAARNVGTRVKRSEDRRILTGHGHYVDDVTGSAILHAAFLRSGVPHARLLDLDVSAARALPGVVAVYTGDDLRSRTKAMVAGAVIGIDQMPGLESPEFWPLAVDRVRFVGDPMVLVVAESRAIAEDACELIIEDFEMLDAIASYDQALDPSGPVIFDDVGTNVSFRGELALGDADAVFSRADRIIRTSLSVHRHQNVPMEGRGSVASWDAAEGRLTFRTSTQSPHLIQMLMAPLLDLPPERIRVLADDVGGGFGLKMGLFREDVAVAAASIDLGQPVKWIEDRGEHLTSSGHAREEKADIEAAVTADGRVLAVRIDAVLDQGAYPSNPFHGGMYVTAIGGRFQGPAKLEAVEATFTAVFSNKASYVAYRGPWASADWMRERLLDAVARELDLDRLEVRRRNYVERGQPPLTMLDGQPYAGVTTRESIEQAAELIDWNGFAARQRAAREEGRYLGLGLASYIEAAPGPRHESRGGGLMGDEVSHLSLGRNGKVVVVTQQQPHGQGHETTLAQVAADELGVAFEDVVVRWGDTDVTPPALVATGGSRAATMASGAVLHGSRELRTNLLSLAAELWEADASDLELSDGTISVKGTPSVQISLGDLVRIAEDEPERLPRGAEAGLRVTSTFDGGEGGWSGGTHCCIVEVDVETGLVRIERYVVVEDCGQPINPAIVEGQVRGGVAQGIGAVLLERSAYDEDGQFLAGTFMDYLLPTTMDVPDLEIHHLETVALDPDVNFRGVGEGGMIIAPATLTSAIEDALEPFGVQVHEQHLPPSRILELIGAIPTE